MLTEVGYPHGDGAEVRIEHWLSRQPLDYQLEYFFNEAEHLDRKWLRSPEINVYVRRNLRDFGKANFYMRYGKEIIELNPTVDCLDIPTIELSGGSIEPWINFIQKVYTRSPWEVIYIDSLTDKNIKKWCRTNGWREVSRKNHAGLTDNSFFMQIPSKESGVILTAWERLK